MLVNCSTYPGRVEKKTRICDYCLCPKSPIYDTKKLGLTTRFMSEVCEDCMLFIVSEKNRARVMSQLKENNLNLE